MKYNFPFMSEYILEIENLTKTYEDGTRALRSVFVKVKRGEKIAILGLSGAGKSTFLRCINRLVTPDDGRIIFKPDSFKEFDMASLSDQSLRYPRSKIGMIFQQFNIIERLTVLKNVLSGSLSNQNVFASILHIFPRDEVERAIECIERVGLMDKAYVSGSSLSGGQKQRVGIARALMQKPVLMLADEPVASLDPETSMNILDVLMKVTEEDSITTLINLHSLEFAKQFAARAIAFKNGEIIYDGAISEISNDVLSSIYK